MLDVVNFPHLKDPRIGVLIQEGREVYYAHIDGEFPVRDTVDEILVLLGVIPEPAPTVEPTDDLPSYTTAAAPDLFARERPGARGEWRDFRVKVVNIDIPWQGAGYFTVRAKSERTAISRVRELMRSPDYHHTRRDGRLRYSVEEDS